MFGKGKGSATVEEPPKADHPICESSWITSIVKRNLQQHSSMREYRVLETDLGSLLPPLKNRKQPKNTTEKTQYIFRLKIEKPSIELYRNESLKQFN
jgi:hypothetical protein